MCFLFGYWFMDYSQNVTSPELIWLAGKIHHEWVDVFPIGKWEFSHADVSELGGSKSDLTLQKKSVSFNVQLLVGLLLPSAIWQTHQLRLVSSCLSHDSRRVLLTSQVG